MKKHNFNLNKLKIAITHDFLVEYGGAERVLFEFIKIFPQADIYTPFYKSHKFPKYFTNKIKKHKITTNKLNYLPFLDKYYKIFTFIIPSFFENLNLNKYDIILSSSSNFAKYINLENPNKHIAYIHTPPRFLYRFETSTFHKIPKFIKILLKPHIKKLKNKDQKYTKKINLIITNSKNIQKKIKMIYNKNSIILYPPVNIKKFLNNKIPKNKKNYYITISRLYPYKHIDIIVKVFNDIEKQLIIIGKGPELENLKKIAKKNIKFKGFVSEKEKINLLQQARGFIFMAEEDFGIVLVEALASGIPVIAFNKGGAKEIIKQDKTGILFDKQNTKSLIKAIKKFEQQEFNINDIIKEAQRYSSQTFKDNLIEILTKHIANEPK